MFSPSNDYHKEIMRKMIHLSSLWIPVLYFFLPKESMLMIVGGVMVLVVIFDLCRIFVPAFRTLAEGLVGMMMRAHEKNKLSGSSFFVIGALLTIILFPKAIAITALLVLVISDSCASLIGKRFGKRRLLTKTWEGTLAFMASGWIVVAICFMVFNLPLMFVVAGIIAVFIGAWVELISGIMHIDDNVTIPLSVAGVMAAIHGVIPYL